MIKLEQVQKQFDGKLLFEPLSLDIVRGESLAIIGETGCGKSTLLKMIAGFDKPDGGRILIAGEEQHGIHPAVGIILQKDGLLPWRKGYDNLALGLKSLGRTEQTYRKQVLDMAGMLKIEHCLQRYPQTLSGGERRRIALGRTLLMHPQILLIDEGLQSLDSMTAQRLQEEIKHITRQQGITLIVVTHSIEEAVFLGQRILWMKPGRKAEYFDNALSNQPHWRDSVDYHAMVTDLKRRLEQDYA